jgi:hypothetical protein
VRLVGLLDHHQRIGELERRADGRYAPEVPARHLLDAIADETANLRFAPKEAVDVAHLQDAAKRHHRAG